jgi:hypothetical protein
LFFFLIDQAQSKVKVVSHEKEKTFSLSSNVSPVTPINQQLLDALSENKISKFIQSLINKENEKGF